MQHTFEILDLKAVLPSCGTPEEHLEWAEGRCGLSREGKYPRSQQVPKMTARRLDTGCKLAVELVLELTAQHPGIQAVVFSSRHGVLTAITGC